MNAESREEIDKLMAFFKSRDYNHIDSGIELIRSMDDPSIYEVLLDNCSIGNEGQFVINPLFSSNGIESPHLDYILLNLIAYASEDCNLDDSLKRSNIESLLLEFHGLAYCVKQGIPEDEEEQQINDIVSLPDCISSLTKLTNLCLSGELLQNADALANCVNLTRLELASWDSLKQVDFLPNLTNLTDLTLSFRLADQELQYLEDEMDADYCEGGIYEIFGESSIENIDGLKNCSQLKRLTIERADFDVDLYKLSKLSNLTHLELNECDLDFIDIDNKVGLSKLINLTSLHLSNFEPYNSFSSNKSAGGDSWTVDTDIAAVEEEGEEECEEDEYPETVANLEELHALVVKFLE